MKLLLSRLSALGDVVCTLPAATILKAAFPESHLTWIADRRFAAIPRLCQAVDEVLVLEKNPRQWPAQMRALTIPQNGAQESPFDAALDLQGLAKSAFPLLFAKARHRLAYHWQREGSWLVASPVRPDPASVHVVDQYADVARAAVHLLDPTRPVPVPDPQNPHATFALRPSPEDLETVRQTLAQSGQDPARPLVLMNAGAGWATKRWPPESFAALAHTLHDAGADVAFLGTEADRPAFAAVQKDFPAAIDLLGRTNVAQLVALVSLAKIHVAGDTGSTHLAAALGIPALGLYTLTRPERSAPYGQLPHAHSTALQEVIPLAHRLLQTQKP